MDVILVGWAMAAEVDKMSTVNVTVSAMDVFKKFGAVISRDGDVVLECVMVVWSVAKTGMLLDTTVEE